LGCTHYPLLKDVIARVAGPSVTLVDTAEETVRAVREQLEALGLRRNEEDAGAGERRFFVSDIPAQFSQVGGRFLGTPIMQVEWVDQSDLPWFER
jgi:glutamate racemase